MSSSAEGGGSAFRDFNKSRFPRLRRENDKAVILRENDKAVSRRENDKAVLPPPHASVIPRQRRGICSSTVMISVIIIANSDKIVNINSN
jgi:hypothetical protein